MSKKAEAPKIVKPIDEVRKALERMGDQLKMALPAHISPDKFQRVVMTAIQQNPELLEGDRHSLYAACMKTAQDGLLPDGRESALVIYNTNVGTKAQPKWLKKVQYMPMIYGILKKVRNSGELLSISPHIVYENDEFDFWIDENGEHIKHRPTTGERGLATRVYALAKTKSDGTYIEVMTAEEIEQIRNASRAKDGPAWKQWWGEMWKKSVLRRLSKRLPMSTDLEQVIRADDELFDLNKTEERDVTQKTKPARLAAAIAEEGEEKPSQGEPPQESENDELPPFEDFK